MRFSQSESLDMLRSYVKIAVRSLLRDKLTTLTNLAGMSIGMAVALVLLLWVADELSFNDNFAGHDRIARVLQNVTKNGEVVTWRDVPVPLSDELRRNYGSDFEAIVLVNRQSELLSVGNKILTKYGLYAEPDFFKLFSTWLISGRDDQLTGTSGIYLSESVARTYFGESDALGRSMTITSSGSDGGPIEVLVAGVYEDFPTHSAFGGTDYIAPWDVQGTKPWIRNREEPWKYNFVEVYVKINDATSFDSASSRIKDARLLKVSSEVAKMKPALFLFPMDDWHLFADFKNGKKAGGRIQYVWLFGAIAGFILVMACINFMNLTTAKSERRAKETGVRKSIGSGRSQLIVLFLTESALVTLMSFFIAVALVVVALPAFSAFADKDISIPWLDPLFWSMTFISCGVITILCGLYPATYLSSIAAIDALKGTYRSKRSATTLRRGLVVVQFSISVVLVVVTTTVSQQIQFAMDRPTGYDRDALITVPVITDVIHNHMDAFQERLTKGGAVVSIAEASDPPTVRSYTTTSIKWQGKDPDLVAGFTAFAVSQQYGKTIGWQLKLGRDYRQDNLSDTTGIIINEAAMKYMGFGDPIGQKIQWFDDQYTIIGVVHNVIHESPYQVVQPALYTLNTYPGRVIIMRTDGKTELPSVVGQIASAFKEFNPGEPFSYQFVSDEYLKKFGSEEYIGRLTRIFSGLAIFISCLGLVGLVSYVAERRTKEIGIRKVLGASVMNIWMMLSGEFVLLVMIAGVVAVPLGHYAIHSWLERYDYRIDFTGWLFVQAILLVLVATLIAASYRTIKAARRNPVKSLRSE